MTDIGDRLDRALVARNVVGSRTRAQRLIAQGDISVNGTTVRKASYRVFPSDRLEVASGVTQYVSRGAHKLIGAFRAFSPHGLLSPAGRVCLDIGASTGGFTQVLLRSEARLVMALDVGHGQLAASLVADPRVINMEGINIRDVTADLLPAVPTYIVSDVSFISLTYVIPVIARICAHQGGRIGAHAPHAQVEILLLIKPQFEVGKGRLGKNGIVTDPRLREMAKKKVIDCAEECGLQVCGCVDSPIEGEHGNREYLLWLRG
jgi:23S rRNA (cytidine1920-2'-O)/16S rRNA (cytidine1409-2'-O)-methyltransferase